MAIAVEVGGVKEAAIMLVTATVCCAVDTVVADGRRPGRGTAARVRIVRVRLAMLDAVAEGAIAAVEVGATLLRRDRVGAPAAAAGSVDTALLTDLPVVADAGDRCLAGLALAWTDGIAAVAPAGYAAAALLLSDGWARTDTQHDHVRVAAGSTIGGCAGVDRVAATYCDNQAHRRQQMSPCHSSLPTATRDDVSSG